MYKQPVVVDSRVYNSITEAAKRLFQPNSTVRGRCMNEYKHPKKGKYGLKGKRLNRDNVRKKNIKVVFENRLYDTYVEAGEAVGYSPSYIRKLILRRNDSRNYLIDSNCWRIVDPETGDYRTPARKRR